MSAGDMSIAETVEAYADLTVNVGLNVRPGQLLIVDCFVEHAPFVRAVADAAYGSGARFVDVRYQDDIVRRSHISKSAEELLNYSPPWLVDRVRAAGEEHAAALIVKGEPHPYALAGIDGARVGNSQMRAHQQAWIEQVAAADVSWTIVGCPTEGWAEQVLGEPDLEALWRLVAAAVRLDEPDPAASWRRHSEILEERRVLLNERRFDAIEFRGPGTDLTIGLLPNTSWGGGRHETSWGAPHWANMPTEEVFTSPDPTRADGVVRSTRPLVLLGSVVRGLEMSIRNGEIVAVRAQEGEELVRSHLATDETACRLGEVALVDGSSRVGQAGVTFYSTLFDENTTSHIAYGTGFPTLAGAPDQVNRSAVHTDFMVGGSEVAVTGVERGGRRVPILAGDEWQLV